MAHAGYVTLTGGEPLLQRELPDLSRDLLLSLDIKIVGDGDTRPAAPGRCPRRSLIDHRKDAGSGEVTTEFTYLDALRPGDEVKFVVCDKADFDWSVAIVRSGRAMERLKFYDALLPYNQNEQIKSAKPSLTHIASS